MAKVTAQEATRKRSNQSLCLATSGPRQSSALERAAEAPQLDAEHDRPDHGGKPAHRDGDRQGGADNVVESLEKTGDRDDAGKADRRANDAFRCPDR